MRTIMIPALLVLTFGGAAWHPLAAQEQGARCEYTKRHPMPAGSTLEDQFKCYKDAGRRVSIPGTGLVYGGVHGAGCIVSIAADRVQVASCNSFTDRAITIPFASIRFVFEEEMKDYVTVDLRE